LKKHILPADQQQFSDDTAALPTDVQAGMFNVVVQVCKQHTKRNEQQV
jgi:hypothetical protein